VARAPRQRRPGFGEAPENLRRVATVAPGTAHPESLAARVPRQPGPTAPRRREPAVTSANPAASPGAGATLEDVARRNMQELAEAARALGHVLEVERRDFDEYDAPPKFYVRCSCGYAANVRRTERTAYETAAWHIGKVVGESGDIFRRNGVVLPRAARG
jgi:hypothetical protein